MSRGYNKNGVYVDTGLLRDHISKLRQENKLATELYDSISAMKAVSDSAVAYQYDMVLREIGQIIEYLNTMANQLARIEEEAAQLSYELRGMIEDSTDLSHHIITRSFVL